MTMVKLAKKKKPTLPGQVKHKGFKAAMDHIRDVLTELHTNEVKKVK